MLTKTPHPVLKQLKVQRVRSLSIILFLEHWNLLRGVCYIASGDERE